MKKEKEGGDIWSIAVGRASFGRLPVASLLLLHFSLSTDHSCTVRTKFLSMLTQFAGLKKRADVHHTLLLFKGGSH